MSLKYVQAPILYLAGSGSLIGATSITVTSLTDIYGNILTMTDFGSKGYGSHEPDSTNSEAIVFTGVTANANGTYTLTGVSSALAKSPYTESSGLVRNHAGGTKFVITDSAAFWNTFGNKQNDETLTGRWGTGVAPSAGNDLVNKTYADGLAIAGAPDASTTTKGIVKMSVAPASAVSPIAVGDNDTRVPTANQAAALAGTGTPSGANKFVTADTDALKQLLSSLVTSVTGASDVNYPSEKAVYTIFSSKKNGTTTKDCSDASTTQNIAHGLGRTPIKVRITAFTPLAGYQALTVYNGTTQSSISCWYNNAFSTSAEFKLNANTGSGGNAYNSGVVTFDGTNIIITWTKAGSPTGTYTLLWEAE